VDNVVGDDKDDKASEMDKALFSVVNYEIINQ
jgi:hypothetical protein